MHSLKFMNIMYLDGFLALYLYTVWCLGNRPNGNNNNVSVTVITGKQCNSVWERKTNLRVREKDELGVCYTLWVFMTARSVSGTKMCVYSASSHNRRNDWDIFAQWYNNLSISVETKQDPATAHIGLPQFSPLHCVRHVFFRSALPVAPTIRSRQLQVQPVWWIGNQFPEKVSRSFLVSRYLSGRSCPVKGSLFLCASQHAISGWFPSGTKCNRSAVTSVRCYAVVALLKYRQLHVHPEFLSYIFTNDERVCHLTLKNWRPRRWRGNNYIRQEIGNIYIELL